MTARGWWRPVLGLARVDQKLLWRDRQLLVATWGIPLAYLALLPQIVHGSAGTGVPYSHFLVAGTVAVAVVSGTYSNLAIALPALREILVLKRLRGTPLTTAQLALGKLLSLGATTGGNIVLVVVAGRLGYGVPLPVEPVTFLLFVALGVVVFSVIGVAFASLVRSPQAAVPLVQLPYVGLQFVSGVFFPVRSMPGWAQTVAGVLPLRGLVDGLRAGYLGTDAEHGRRLAGVFEPQHFGLVTSVTSQSRGLLVLVVWALVGLQVARGRFRWERRSTSAASAARPATNPYPAHT